MRMFVKGTGTRNAESGFTILETVIALFVAMVVGFGAISLFLFAASFNAGASDRARALAVAQERMEELRSETYADLTVGETTTTVTRGGESSGDTRSFSVKTRVENDATTSPANRQKKITVTVSPSASEGRFNPGGVTLVMLRASDLLGEN